MLRFLAKLVLLLAALFFALLMIVAGLGVVAGMVAPVILQDLRVGLPPDAHFIVYSALPRLSVIAAPIVLVCLMICLALVAWRVLAQERAKGDDRSELGENRMVQEVYQGLSHLEERVEALETILMRHAGEAPGPSGC
jgi:phage shock protein B